MSWLRQYAETDALADGAGDDFLSFRHRLPVLVNLANEKADVFHKLTEIRQWRDQIHTESNQVRVDTHADADGMLNDLREQTNGAFISARGDLGSQIIRLQQEYTKWNNRFPELKNHLDEPKKGNAWFLIGVILFLFAGESIMNSVFFAEADAFGLLGGTLRAFGISAGNILIPILLSYFSHSLCYDHDERKSLAGRILIGIAVGWTISFNILVWIHREGQINQAGGVVTDLNSVLLFAIGTAAAVVSFWKIWAYLDPYKKARKCSRKLKQNKEALKDRTLQILYDEKTKQRECLRKAEEINSKLINQIPSIRVDLSEFNHDCIAGANTLLQEYHLSYCQKKIGGTPDLPQLNEDNAVENRVGMQPHHYGLITDVESFQKNWKQELEQLRTKVEEFISKIILLIKHFELQIHTTLSELESKARG